MSIQTQERSLATVGPQTVVDTRERDRLLRNLIRTLSPEEIARFWAKVQVGPGCWLWLASQYGGGYGQAVIRRRHFQAHRVAYELVVGPIPEGHDLDHVKARGCTNRNCVNPSHLEPVTRRVNVLRGESPVAHQAQQTHCKNGHEFTPENTRYRAGRNIRSCRACSTEYNRAAWARKKAAR